ncbi:replication initiator protein A [Jiella mangrovi]|uniref:Replication initiator protein A n=1 Tax=Jiella mangrovi TaxID=2821407 RepID=A0ABS4BNC3_9HYPH|nr:replication initiator protein A [Jiella mangrovi]MBP0618252.1 replication initiator protein A [Jiella mangrovi]
MSRHKLNLLDRSAFAALSLHEKNAYLQNVVKEIQAVRGEPYVPLDKDALSRLRRFYSRRSFADLRLNSVKDDGLRQSFSSLAESIHLGEVKRVITHEAPSSPRPVSRPAPLDDDQLMFFVPAVHDAPVKDDLNLMDIAPFSLSKTVKDRVLRYELKDSIVTIEGGADVGLATAYDYDIFINMVSHLTAEVREYTIARNKGLRPNVPARIYRPSATELLKFCRRSLGGKQYLELEKSLDRLQATRVKITNLNEGKRRETESFPLIGRFRVVSRTQQDRIDQVEIEIPTWVYDGVVSPDGRPSILTLNPAYFLIARPLGKYLYRLARRTAGDGEAFYRIDDVHTRSGSSLSATKFRKTLEQLVEDCKADPLPDYDLEIRPGTNGKILYMQKRKMDAATQTALPV